MNTNLKKVILIFGGGLLVYWVFTKIKPFGGSSKKKSSSKSETKSVSEEDKKNAAIIITAYKNAVKDGQPKSFLDEMNQEFATTYNLKVYTNKGNGSLFVADLDGNKII